MTAAPSVVHLIKLDAHGGLERMFEGFWRHQPAPRLAFNLDARVHALLAPLFTDGECVPYKSAGLVPLPKWPAFLRALRFNARAAANGARLALLWNLLGTAVPRRDGAALRFIHYDHGAVWKGARSARNERYLREVDGIVCCSRANAEMFQRHWGYRGPLEVCLNGLLPQYRLAAQPRSLPAGRRLRIGAVARLAEEKGLPMLLHAVALLRKDGVDAELHLAGDGPDRAALERLARGLEIDCRFHGMLADVAPFYQSVDLVAVPSLYESFPLVCVEAAAHALPVVATHAGGIGEVVQDGVTGVCVPPRHAVADYPRFGGDASRLGDWMTWFPAENRIGPLQLVDPGDFARSLKTVLADPARYAAMSAAALAHARAEFPFDAYLSRMRAALARLAA